MNQGGGMLARWLSANGAAATTGSLPGPAQDAVSKALGSVGVSIPASSHSHAGDTGKTSGVGDGGTPPGHGGTPPGHSVTTAGARTAHGVSNLSPGAGNGTPPGQGGTPPGQVDNTHSHATVPTHTPSTAPRGRPHRRRPHPRRPRRRRTTHRPPTPTATAAAPFRAAQRTATPPVTERPPPAGHYSNPVGNGRR